MTIREVLRRLDAAEAMIRPANSIGARWNRLTTDQRASYDAWHAARAKWTARHSDEPSSLFKALLGGYAGPTLPSGIRNALYGDEPRILQRDSEAEAAAKWQKAMEL